MPALRPEAYRGLARPPPPYWGMPRLASPTRPDLPTSAAALRYVFHNAYYSAYCAVCVSVFLCFVESCAHHLPLSQCTIPCSSPVHHICGVLPQCHTVRPCNNMSARRSSSSQDFHAPFGFNSLGVPRKAQAKPAVRTRPVPLNRTNDLQRIKNLVVALGGFKVVGLQLGISGSLVFKWTTGARAISPAHGVALLEMARALVADISGMINELEHEIIPASQQRRAKIRAAQREVFKARFGAYPEAFKWDAVEPRRQ